MAAATRFCVVLLGLGILIAATGVRESLAQSRPRVDAGAREILAYRLSQDALRRIDAVMRTMDLVPSRGPEAPRGDVAIVVVLNMSFAYNEPWRAATVDETVRTIETGHHELAVAIRRAGMSTRDYVLAHMNLLLAYPVVAQRRQGRIVQVQDVAPENLAWVDANWADVERLMNDLRQRIAAARGGRP
jgi:hypothetical protein